MDIPSVSLDGLCRLGELDNTTFATLVDGVYDVLSNKMNTQALLNRVGIADKEDIVDSLLLFIAEACRKNVNTGTIKELLEDLQISPDKVSRFVASHKVKHLTLKSVLSATKPSRGSVLDVKWKLEYCRGECGKEGGPRYAITLITDTPTPLHFYCNPAQLADLVAHLQSATFSIDKFISAQGT